MSESPGAVSIIDTQGQELRTLTGPHAPGSRIVLRCLSTGGIITHFNIIMSPQKKKTLSENYLNEKQFMVLFGLFIK